MSGECYSHCARDNLIEADVLPCQYEPTEKLLLDLTPSTLQLLMAQHKEYENPKRAG